MLYNHNNYHYYYITHISLIYSRLRCLQVINSCTNLDELGIPSAISAYNAKPIMIRRTGSITRGVNDGKYYMYCSCVYAMY